MTTYRFEVDVRDDLRVRPPGMERMVDSVADELERLGFTDKDYEVIVHGPAELSIVVVPR